MLLKRDVSPYLKNADFDNLLTDSDSVPMRG
jgi:hypothetical protein